MYDNYDNQLSAAGMHTAATRTRTYVSRSLLSPDRTGLYSDASLASCTSFGVLALTYMEAGGRRAGKATEALFSFQNLLQNFSDSSSHRIFRRIHRVLNIDKNKN